MEVVRNASSELSIHFPDIPSRRYKKVTKHLIGEFQLESVSELTVGLDEKFASFRAGSALIGLEWDVWSGYIVFAKNETAEELVRRIADWISQSVKQG